MMLPEPGTAYTGSGGARKVKWVHEPSSTVCYQIMVRGLWRKGGVSTTLQAWQAWMDGADEAEPPRALPHVCPHCQEESDAGTPEHERNHAAGCRLRPRVAAPPKPGELLDVVWCPACRQGWRLHPPWKLSRKESEANALWMPGHLTEDRRRCAGFFFTVDEIRQIRHSTTPTWAQPGRAHGAPQDG